MTTTLRNVEPGAAEAETDVLTDESESQERFRIYVLCDCDCCKGRGKVSRRQHVPVQTDWTEISCPECRGEGKLRRRVAECPDEASLGVAIVTLGREGEFEDCPIGILDTKGEVGQKWLVRPWLPSARNTRDAARELARKRWQ